MSDWSSDVCSSDLPGSVSCLGAWSAPGNYTAPKRRTRMYVMAPMAADAGMVRIHAQTICVATPHRTAERRRVDPTPTLAPVTVGVVLMQTSSDELRVGTECGSPVVSRWSPG